MIALMFIGTLLPNIEIGQVSVSVGGALIPLGVCGYLLFKADTAWERARTVLGAVLTAAAIYGLSMLLPDEPEAMWMDPLLLYGIAAGVIACLLGRSRRGAFVCGVIGVMLADIVTAIGNWRRGVMQQLVLGGAGIADAVILAGMTGLLLAELVGEIMERFAHRREKGGQEDET